MALYEMELGRDWIMVASLAAASASSFLGTSECPGTHWIVMLPGELRKFWRMSAAWMLVPDSFWHRDLLSVQMRMIFF